MAIINSVVIGAGRRKVGEITLSTIRGRTIARQYQPNVTNPQTPAQQANRRKMTNVQLLWAAWGWLLKKGQKDKGRYQSAYNRWVQKAIKIVQTNSAADWWEVSDLVQGVLTSDTFDATVFEAETENNRVVAYLDNATGELGVGDIVYYMQFNANTLAFTQSSYTITQADLTTQKANMGQKAPNFGYGWAILVKKDGSKSWGCLMWSY